MFYSLGLTHLVYLYPFVSLFSGPVAHGVHFQPSLLGDAECNSV